MRIDDFGGNADGGKWTFREGKLTWGTLNSKWGKMGGHHFDTLFVDHFARIFCISLFDFSYSNHVGLTTLQTLLNMPELSPLSSNNFFWTFLRKLDRLRQPKIRREFLNLSVMTTLKRLKLHKSYYLCRIIEQKIALKFI